MQSSFLRDEARTCKIYDAGLNKNVYERSFFVLCLLCICLYVPCGHLLGKDWLSFVVSSCEFVTFPLVSWVRCGT